VEGITTTVMAAISLQDGGGEAFSQEDFDKRLFLSLVDKIRVAKAPRDNPKANLFKAVATL
jgi:hypothetical protein